MNEDELFELRCRVGKLKLRIEGQESYNDKFYDFETPLFELVDEYLTKLSTRYCWKRITRQMVEIYK